MARIADEKTRRQQLHEEIRELAQLMRECDLAEVVIEEGKESRKLVVRRSVGAPRTPTEVLSPSISARAGGSPPPDSEEIRAPLPGTFYTSPRPGEPPFVNVGDRVETGQVLCIIEAMKLMNEVEAEFPCEILEVLVENATPVGYGHPLFRVRRL